MYYVPLPLVPATAAQVGVAVAEVLGTEELMLVSPRSERSASGPIPVLGSESKSMERLRVPGDRVLADPVCVFQLMAEVFRQTGSNNRHLESGD